MGFGPTPVASTSGLAAGGDLAGNLFGSVASIANPLSAGLSALASFSTPAGPSNAEGSTGAVTPTGWGTFNNPFIISTNGSTVKDVTNRTDANTSLDNRAPGAQTNGGVNTSPLVEGGGSIMAMVTVGVVAFLIVGLIKAKGG